MSENELMRGNEFIKKIQKLAKKRRISASVDSKR
jgi:mRNA interferase HicA